MNIYDIPGWMTAYDLRILIMIAKHVPKNGSILEIGCFLGRSTTALYNGKDSSVSLEVIDPFEDICSWAGFKEIPSFTKANCSGSETLYNVAMHIAQRKNWLESFRFCVGNVMYNNLDVYQGTSQTHIIEKEYDLVFIDGAHSYEGVKHDIMKYSSETTLLVGDDFLNGHPGVSQAINETRDYRTLVVFNESKLWVLIPKSGYWRNMFKTRALAALI
jgi:predicted O-methyltransferase YrrM